ncbi:MAG: GntR family transcriptional regulator [Steroidobacteraceae bacterium]
MDASDLSIRPGAPEPIYRQIMEQLRRLIAGNQLRTGEPLPSVRDVAARHAVNPMTVSRAYGLLESEGLLERQRGRGMVVAALRRRAQTDERRLEHLEPRLRDLARAAHELDLPGQLVLDRLKQLLEDGQ